jgi:hypothetical protein
MTVTRVLLLLLLSGVPAAGLAEGAPFAALTVTPAGRQVFDLTTGVTPLPDGGEVVDQDTGVALQATTIEYRDGAYIDATGVRVRGSFGALDADALHIDIAAATLEAHGHLRLERAGLTVQAARVHFDAGRDVADFAGPVRGDAPAFEADRVLLDTRSGNVLLVGRYSFEDGLFTLTSPASGGRLELQFVGADGNAAYDAATEVDPALLERFATELD